MLLLLLSIRTYEEKNDDPSEKMERRSTLFSRFNFDDCRRCIASNSCWTCVIISCPLNESWQIGHCGFCRSMVDDRQRWSAENEKKQVRVRERGEIPLNEIYVFSVKSLIILLLLDHYHSICQNSLRSEFDCTAELCCINVRVCSAPKWLIIHTWFWRVRKRKSPSVQWK